MKRSILAALCLLCLLLCAGCAEEKAVTPDFVLTYADNQPAHYPTTLGAEKFAALVKERTGGKVVVQVKSGGQYGTEQEVLDQMLFGGIDFARLSLATLSDELPKLNVLQLPFLYRDAGHMWRVLDGEIGEEFLLAFQEIGLTGLSWYDAGARSFYAAGRPIRGPEDLAGLTVRVQDSQILLDMVALLGAEPITFSYSDVYYAFETQKIDAAENNWSSYQAMEHYKAAPYYTADEHSRVPEIQLASGRTWEKLPEKYRAVILQCAKESALYERSLWVDWEATARAAVLKKGCEEIALTEEARAAFREIVQPLYEQYGGEYQELIRQIQEG